MCAVYVHSQTPNDVEQIFSINALSFKINEIKLTFFHKVPTSTCMRLFYNLCYFFAIYKYHLFQFIFHEYKLYIYFQVYIYFNFSLIGGDLHDHSWKINWNIYNIFCCLLIAGINCNLVAKRKSNIKFANSKCKQE